MISREAYSLLSLYVYFAESPEDNRPLLDGWTELELHPNNSYGFSYGVFKKGDEVVISYTGTNDGIDWPFANLTNAIGLSSAQTTEAALVYLAARSQYPDANITFTGHSLGGGLASIMAVWFDRPATVFDEAPFQDTAKSLLAIYATKAALTLAGFDLGAFKTYDVSIRLARS
jgi:hypothetical protein